MDGTENGNYPFHSVDSSILINWTSPFPILRGSGVHFHFYLIFHRNSCMQTVQSQIRRRVLIRVYTVGIIIKMGRQARTGKVHCTCYIGESGASFNTFTYILIIFNYVKCGRDQEVDTFGLNNYSSVIIPGERKFSELFKWN